MAILTSPAAAAPAQLSAPLSIPLDSTVAAPPKTIHHRRDSLARRQGLLRGKEGSRRRQRWENDNFTKHPNYAPPKAEDWVPGPLYPKRAVPYQYAGLWEHPEFQQRREEGRAEQKQERKVPRGLRERVKKERGIMTLLEELERKVRGFVFGEVEEKYEEEGVNLEKANTEEEDGVHVEKEPEEVDVDSEEEIVFVSRKVKRQKDVAEKVLFESPVEDSFGRWLVHALAAYYDLRSWSVTKGQPEMRYAYVAKKGVVRDVPRPLYLML